MDQEEEIVFSLNKIKRILLKYWYIVLIAFLIGAVYVGVSSFVAYSSAKASAKVSAAKAASDSEEDSEDVEETEEDRLSPTGTTYFNLEKYILVDWSSIYPEGVVSDENSAEDNYYITSRNNSQISYENTILSNCKNILSYQSFRDDVNAALESADLSTLTSTDSMSCTTYNNNMIKFTIYSQCSERRITVIMDAMVDSFIRHGQTYFKLGTCSDIVTNSIKAYSKGTDGKYTYLNKTASEWLEEELAKDDTSEVSASDTGDETVAVVSSVSLKSTVMTKKNIIVLVGALIAGLGVLCVIAVFDHVLDVPEEVSFTGLDKLGEVSLKDVRSNSSDKKPSAEAYLLSSRVFKERMATIAETNGFRRIALVTMQDNPMIEAICSGSESEKSYAGMTEYVYPGGYLASISDIHDCDAAIIAVHGGIDKKTVLRQCVENLSIDNSKLLGYVWIAG